MTFDKKFIEKKLEELGGYQKEIENYFRFSDKEILADSEKLHIGERLLQLTVDTMIDINQHFIKELNLRLTDDFQSTFEVLAEHGILTQDFAAQLAPVVGLRNRIVHRYETIKKKLFLTSFRKNFQDFDAYLKHIYAHLESKQHATR